jgi:hypothetical protein
MVKVQTTLVASPGFEPAGASRVAPNSESRYAPDTNKLDFLRCGHLEYELLAHVELSR